jgi:thioredoxin reductase (NADPH)
MKRADFTRLLAGEPDLCEIIIQAFMPRRGSLIRHSQSGVLIVGSGRAGETVRLQSFLIRNGYPQQLIDTDLDKDANGLVAFFGLVESGLPAVVLSP